MSDIETKRPLKYFDIHYFFLRILGLGQWHDPGVGNTNNFEGWYLYYSIITELIWVAGFIGLESIDPFIGQKDLDRFILSLSFVITHDLTCIKISIFVIKNVEFQDIVRTLEIDLYQYYQNKALNRRTVKITKIISSLFVFFGWITILNASISAILQDKKWKADFSLQNETIDKPLRTLPMPVYIPWNYESDGTYIFTFVFATCGLLWTGHIVLITDTFIATIIYHLSSQFVILQEAIETAYDRTITQLLRNTNETDPSIISEGISSNNEDMEETLLRRSYTEEEIEAALSKTFTHCYQQHQLLISCVEKFAETYSYGFMTQLVSSMAAICVVMVQVSHDASTLKSLGLITSLAFFAAMIVQLALQCFTGNELTLQETAGGAWAAGLLSVVRLIVETKEAGRVADSVMRCKWELLPVRLRRGLLMMMMRAQRPLRLTAARFFNIDNDCFLAIMKAAYSYYAVLSQRLE